MVFCWDKNKVSKVSKLQTDPIAEECWPRNKIGVPVLFGTAWLPFKLGLFSHSSHTSQLPAPKRHTPNLTISLPTARAMTTFNYNVYLRMMHQEESYWTGSL